jgi:hypothetical protein
MNITLMPYSGWMNCLRINNSEIEIIATLDVGPRIIRFGFCGERNEFAEYPDQIGLSGDRSYHSYGGHRLWAAPEVQGWTNHPDNNPVEYEENENTVILTAPIENGTKLQKQICLHMDAKRNHVQVVHTITNCSTTKLKLAPWAISVLAPGGRAIVPQEPFLLHSQSVLPVRPLVLWGYTEMQDARWKWGNRFIQLQQDAQAQTVQKFGACITQGWAAYVNANHVFLKRFPYSTHATYADFGCNAEFFTNSRMLEVESLGPLITIKPGESVTHKEDWFLFRGVQVGQTDEDIESALKPLLETSTVVKET